MKLIELHITYLLTRHDCVIVPGWGAFVASYEPARIDSAAGVIFPPRRTITFNPSLSHNDGLLATSISRGKGISYDQANDTMAAEVKAMHADLQAQGHLIMDQLGTFLIQGGSRSPMFTPADSPLTSADCYALRPVAAPALRDVVRRDAIIRGELSPMPRSPFTWLRTATRIAASVALLAGLGILLSTPISIDQGVDRASINPIASISAPKPATAPAVATVMAPANESIMRPANAASEEHDDNMAARNTESAVPVKVDSPKALPADTQTKKAATKKVETKTAGAAHIARRLNADDPYCLIVASLPSRAEAETYISRAADKSLQILEKDGKYRIYAATGLTKAQAQAHISNGTLGRKYPGAWVCHR